MSEPIRLHLDENCDINLATELRNHGIDVTTTYDVGLAGSNDRKQLEFANAEKRVIVSHDNDMVKFHKARVPHHGIIFRKIKGRTIAGMTQGILRVCETNDRDGMIGILVKLTDRA